MFQTFNRTIAWALGALTIAIGAQTLCATPLLDVTVFPVTVMPGDLGVTVLGTVTNNTGDVVYINGDSENLAANLATPGSTMDLFLTTAPISLSNGGTTGPLELFTFNVPVDAPLGTFNAGDFQVLGGIGADNQFNFDVVGSQTVQVTVTPEPGGPSYLAIAFSLLGIAAATRSVRRRMEASRARA